MNTQITLDSRIAFFSLNNARPDYSRSVLSTAWKLLQLDALVRNVPGDKWDDAIFDLAKTIDYLWVEEVMRCQHLEIYYRRMLGGQRALMAMGRNRPRPLFWPMRQDDNTVDHVLISDIWDNTIDILELSTGERINANTVFETNADMYKPYALINGESKPILSLMHMGI